MFVRINVTCNRPELNHWVTLVPVHETVYEVLQYILDELYLSPVVKPEDTEFVYEGRVMPLFARPWWIRDGDSVHLIIHDERENS